MSELGVEVAVPFFVDQKLQGILLLGHKKNSALFHYEEVRRLGILAKAKEQNFALALLIESQEDLVLISRRIAEMESLKTLGEYLVQIMMRTLNSEYSAIYLHSAKQETYKCEHMRGNVDAVLSEVEKNLLSMSSLNFANSAVCRSS